MEAFNNILVISRMNPYSRKAVARGVSLARRYEAKLHVLHLAANSFDLMVLIAPGLFPENEYRNYTLSHEQIKEQLDRVIKEEAGAGFPIHEIKRDRDHVEETLNVVTTEKIDLIIMTAHEVGRIEHALFGGENDAIIRKMPCSILLVKNDSEEANW